MGFLSYERGQAHGHTRQSNEFDDVQVSKGQEKMQGNLEKRSRIRLTCSRLVIVKRRGSKSSRRSGKRWWSCSRLKKVVRVDVDVDNVEMMIVELLPSRATFYSCSLVQSEIGPVIICPFFLVFSLSFAHRDKKWEEVLACDTSVA